MGEKHAHARDKKAKKRQQDKHGQWGKSTHTLQTRRQEKVSKANMGDGEKHAQARDEKARKSEQDKHG
jgi:hypothetical protein